MAKDGSMAVVGIDFEFEIAVPVGNDSEFFVPTALTSAISPHPKPLSPQAGRGFNGMIRKVLSLRLDISFCVGAWSVTRTFVACLATI